MKLLLNRNKSKTQRRQEREKRIIIIVYTLYWAPSLYQMLYKHDGSSWLNSCNANVIAPIWQMRTVDLREVQGLVKSSQSGKRQVWGLYLTTTLCCHAARERARNPVKTKAQLLWPNLCGPRVLTMHRPTALLSTSVPVPKYPAPSQSPP